MKTLASSLSIAVSLTTAWSSLATSEAELEFNYLPIAHVRTDPIISDSCLSDHVHTFYGPPLVSPSVTTDDLIATDPSDHSGLVEENKSLYWHPSIYRVSSDGVFTLDEIYYASVYYFWDTQAEKKTRSFPKGFRMIASDREAFTECVVGDFKPCARADGCEVPDGVETFFPSLACDMLEITMDFPSCWDGRIDSPDHKDHMAYPDEEDDSCSAPHDEQVPTLSISIYIKDYDGGYHTWSDMSDQFHTDYLSGWDVDLMETFLEGCEQDVDNCDRFLTWKEGGPTGCDTHDEKHDKIAAIMPPLPDTTAIADEPVTDITTLPRGLCEGPFPDRGAPTAAPSDGDPTTPAPTNRPTPAPSPDSSCADDSTLRYRNSQKKNCEWVGRQPDKRCNRSWKGKKLRDFCPSSCSVCGDDDVEDDDDGACEDDPSFRFENDERFTCEWVSKKLSQRCNLNWKTRKVYEYCPETCDECE